MQTTFEHIRVERRDRVLAVTINRPEVRNALNNAASHEMAAAFDAFESDPELFVAIVTGAGDKAFSAGNDLKATAAGAKLDLPPSGFGGLTHRFRCWKPIIAAVNGQAMGGGFEIVLACDVVVAAETAQFALPEPRVGLAPLAGGMHRLARKIGLARAMPLLLTGRRIQAAEARDLGIVAEVAPAAELMPTAFRWAAEIAECSPASLRAVKSVAIQGLDEPSLEKAMGAERANAELKELFASPDRREGPRAFAEKRKPVWHVGPAAAGIAKE